MDIYPYPVVGRNKVQSVTTTPTRNGIIASASAAGTGKNNHRHAVVMVDDDDDAVDPIECTGKSCKSCTAGLVADCVAVCCCPCAVVDILALALFKIPYNVGRKYWVKGKKKKKKKNGNRKLEKKKEIKGDQKSYGYSEGTSPRKSSRNEDQEAEKEKTLGIVMSTSRFREEELKDNFSARFDEEIWLEMYEVCHLGFGRVSFTEISSSQGNKTTTNNV